MLPSSADVIPPRPPTRSSPPAVAAVAPPARPVAALRVLEEPLVSVGRGGGHSLGGGCLPAFPVLEQREQQQQQREQREQEEGAQGIGGGSRDRTLLVYEALSSRDRTLLTPPPPQQQQRRKQTQAPRRQACMQRLLYTLPSLRACRAYVLKEAMTRLRGSGWRRRRAL
jgi:hypothetical protein